MSHSEAYTPSVVITEQFSHRELNSLPFIFPGT